MTIIPNHKFLFIFDNYDDNDDDMTYQKKKHSVSLRQHNKQLGEEKEHIKHEGLNKHMTTTTSDKVKLKIR